MGKKVILGMSGGIDSAVSAYLLREKGYVVEGVYLAMTESYDPVQFTRVQEICDSLNIRSYKVDCKKLFQERVIGPFIREYFNGNTPNPCVMCNPGFKFQVLLQQAAIHEADLVSTGHYARIIPSKGKTHLARAKDTSKDQSYMLYRIKEDILGKIILPLGELEKTEVFSLGRDLFGHSISFQGESQDICFLRSGTVRIFLSEKGDSEIFMPGPIYDEKGVEIGRHKGIFGYTIGQRKGLGLAGGPWFVHSLDVQGNALYVAREESILFNVVKCSDPVWQMEISGGQEFLAQHRYRTRPLKVRIRDISDHSFTVETDDLFKAPAPGQSLVLYCGDLVAGGGIINFSKREE